MSDFLDEIHALADRIESVETPRPTDDGRAYEYWRGYRAAQTECVEVLRKVDGHEGSRIQSRSTLALGLLERLRYITGAWERSVEALVVAIDRAEAAEAVVSRLQALRDEWSSLPVLGPNEQGLLILDDVDVHHIWSGLDEVLSGEPAPKPSRGKRIDHG